MLPSNIQLFPNPATDEIQIQIAIDKKSHLRIEILDLTGKKLKSSYKNLIASGSHTFVEDISRLIPGVYMVHLIQSAEDTGISQSQGIKFFKR
ncbi:MAG: T9SS type A sorting domain-containing protein [Saprospiraceae bacterium]|nr:T9SS type A sorting domain-containing protein [Saprospiraceae bacterium]